ncbi:MAG: DUF58 domain-containing protein [Gammaproteobacteria bacterium]|nr:DUF58 domain-containing protein [Gammaproteobacteria bacterium]
MHPLQELNESELGSLTRIADRLLGTRHMLTRGHRPSRFRAGSGIEFLDHREFSPGDDLRDVDWRATARSKRPQILRYCDEEATDWFIALDCSASMNIENAEKWRLAVQCSAAIAYLLLHQGNRVSLLLFNDKVEQMVPLGQGSTHYSHILRTLRNITLRETGGGSNLNCCISHIKRHSPVFVISDLLAESNMLDGLKALSIHGDSIHLMQILDNRDFQLPEQNNIQLKDIETSQTIQIDLNPKQREEFQISLQGYCEKVASHCIKHHIRSSLHMASETWKSAVVKHLQGEQKA